MAKSVVAAATLVSAAALAFGTGLLQQPERSREPQHEKDSRRIGPTIHRAGPSELAVRNRVAREEQLKIEARQRLHLPSVPATTWVPLGPTNAFNEFNGSDIKGVDSGRPNAIAVDPRDSNVIYDAVSGGGVWKTYNFNDPNGPTWQAVTDTLPNLAVGSFAIDTDKPDTLYIGNGDFVDASGNTVLKSTDGGSTWGAPVQLSGTYPAPSNFPAKVRAVRALGVHGDTVIAGTDVGLFTSTDGGATFTFVDLPNAMGKIRVDSVWSVVHTGNGHWVVSGLSGCDETTGPAPLAQGADPGAMCTFGNNALIWTSADGTTWTPATLPVATGTGRVALAAGPTTDPATTVVYAYVGATDGFSTKGYWRSMDGGATWVDATGTLANPTTSGANGDCADVNLGHDQTWYNQAIVVDPTNPANVLVGGNLCGARTTNGTAASPKWELVSDWLPRTGGGDTAGGVLPYVHADWHTASAVVVNGTVRAFAGTDGGVFSATDLWTNPKPEMVGWTNYNKGLQTHLIYALGSGDPVSADPFVLFAGLQDNGTRFRADPASPSVFNQPVGGDGIGATVHHATSGTTYWGSVEFGHVYCRPKDGDCAMGETWNDGSQGLPAFDADEIDRQLRNNPWGEDAEPFFVHYANVETDTAGQSVLTHTNQIWVSSANAAGVISWKAISQDLTASMMSFTNVNASRTIPGLYGAAGSVSAAPFYFTTTGNTPSTWTVTKPVFPVGDTRRLTGPAYIDFPPVTPAGKQPGDVMIGAFTNTMNDAARTPPPDDKGHLYRSTDKGQTWTSIVGADPAHRLPNVAVYVVKYDPVTPTTIYAGTDVGVYITTDDGATWNRMGDNFPVVPVRDIYVAKNQDFIRVATYGRGLWEIYPSATANHGTDGNGDYDQNQKIDWVDLGAMSARLGETPAVTDKPLYSWILDMTGDGTSPPTASIDAADLTKLLAKFGGHP